MLRPVLLVGLIITAIVLTCFVASAVAEEKSTTVKTAAPAYIHPTSGAEMYTSYCSSCHGAKGLGDGPAASVCKKPPANLAALARKNRGKYPEALVRSTLLQGRADNSAHDEQNLHMPDWSVALGPSAGPNAGVGRLRVKALTDYVATLQVK